MKMPENCDVCRFGDWSNLHQTASCKLKDYQPCFSDYSREFKTQRSTICPLVALPEKHGRMIDFDALIEKYWDGNSMTITAWDLKDIKAVIEAEDE
jgi:hypothetical protein